MCLLLVQVCVYMLFGGVIELDAFVMKEDKSDI